MKLSSIDLNLLLVLHAVLEEKSVGGAAERLHVTPSAVSNALARLRSLLGDPLLVRRGRGVVPTPRALELAPQLEAALAMLRRAIEERFDPALTERRFTLALSDADQACSAPEIAAALSAHMPRATLQIADLDMAAGAEALENGAMDAAIVPAPSFPDLPGMHARDLYEDEAVLLLRRDRRAPARGRLSKSQFNALRHVDTWLGAGKPSLGRRVAEEHFAAHGLERTFVLIVPSYFTAALIAASTDLATAMPRRLADRFTTMLPVRVLAIPGPPLRFRQRLVWHERTHRDPGAMAFRSVLTGLMAGRRNAEV
jgi:DNA-binding transcriptional LysR family regulator